MLCYDNKKGSGVVAQSSLLINFALAIATFIGSMVFLTAAAASAVLITFLLWGFKWLLCCACRGRSCTSTRDGPLRGFGFGMWRRFFEHL